MKYQTKYREPGQEWKDTPEKEVKQIAARFYEDGNLFLEMVKEQAGQSFNLSPGRAIRFIK